MRKWCIGIDLGGTFTKFGLVDRRRRLVHKMQLPTPVADGPEAIVELMAAGAERVISAGGLRKGDVLGVGIGSPGPLSPSKGIIYGAPNLPDMAGVAVREEVAGRLGLPAALENDANAAALGEYLCEERRQHGDLVLLTLGTGIGSGIILDGRILHGSHEIGGELGHLIVEPGGEPCGCGQRGCLERYCSATYVAQYAERLIRQEGCDSALGAVLAEKGRLDARDVNEARRAGDELACRVWDRAAYYLAVGLVSVCRLFDPVEIVLGGGMSQAGDDLMVPLKEHFRRLHWRLTDPRTSIVFSRLGKDAGVIGAGCVAWQEFGPGGA